MLCKLTNITLNKSYICTLEWAMKEFLGFEETLFVDNRAWKSKSKSILAKRNLLEIFLSSKSSNKTALKPQNSLITPL